MVILELTGLSGDLMCLNSMFISQVSESSNGTIVHYNDTVKVVNMPTADDYGDIKTALAGEDFIEVTADSGQKLFISTAYVSSFSRRGAGALIWLNDGLKARSLPVAESYSDLKTTLSAVAP